PTTLFRSLVRPAQNAGPVGGYRFPGHAKHRQRAGGRGEAELQRIALALELVADAAGEQGRSVPVQPVRPVAGGHGDLPLAVTRQVSLHLDSRVDPYPPAVPEERLDNPVVDVVARQIAVRDHELPELPGRGT